MPGGGEGPSGGEGSSGGEGKSGGGCSGIDEDDWAMMSCSSGEKVDHVGSDVGPGEFKKTNSQTLADVFGWASPDSQGTVVVSDEDSCGGEEPMDVTEAGFGSPPSPTLGGECAGGVAGVASGRQGGSGGEFSGAFSTSPLATNGGGDVLVGGGRTFLVVSARGIYDSVNRSLIVGRMSGLKISLKISLKIRFTLEGRLFWNLGGGIEGREGCLE